MNVNDSSRHTGDALVAYIRGRSTPSVRGSGREVPQGPEAGCTLGVPRSGLEIPQGPGEHAQCDTVRAGSGVTPASRRSVVSTLSGRRSGLEIPHVLGFGSSLALVFLRQLPGNRFHSRLTE